jgi:hypothetical protein
MVLVTIEERIGHGLVARNAAPNGRASCGPFPSIAAAAAESCPHPCRVTYLIDILPDNETDTSYH